MYSKIYMVTGLVLAGAVAGAQTPSGKPGVVQKSADGPGSGVGNCRCPEGCPDSASIGDSIGFLDGCTQVTTRVGWNPDGTPVYRTVLRCRYSNGMTTTNACG